MLVPSIARIVVREAWGERPQGVVVMVAVAVIDVGVEGNRKRQCPKWRWLIVFMGKCFFRETQTCSYVLPIFVVVVQLPHIPAWEIK